MNIILTGQPYTDRLDTHYTDCMFWIYAALDRFTRGFCHVHKK